MPNTKPTSEQVTFLASGTGAVQRTALSKFRDTVSVKDFGAVGDGVADDTTAFVNAFATGKATYAPTGTYLVSILNMPSNTFLFGDGAATVIKPLTPTVRCALGADSGSSSAYIENITIRDVRFLGTVAADGFSEQKHLTSFNGVKNMLIENCDFVGFRGDGLYLGSGNSGGQERHNINVTIQSCFFDGVNNDNRNCISIIDGDNIFINNCNFQNSTKPGMPGAIDFEPDGAATFAIGKKIVIQNCVFSNITGDWVFIYSTISSTMTSSPSDIKFINNTIKSSCLTAAALCGIKSNKVISDLISSMGIEISGNIIESNRQAFTLSNVKGVKITGNTYSGTDSAVIGEYGSTPLSCSDVLIQNNTFYKCGTSSSCLIVGSTKRLSIINNLFDQPQDVNCIIFYSPNPASLTESSYCAIAQNNFVTGSICTKMVRKVNHTFLDVKTNSWINNIADTALANEFEAVISDTIETSYSPVITGSTTSGAGVYTLQYGRYRKLGTLVFFKLKIAVNAGHTGTGAIQIGLPTLVVAATSNAETSVSIAVDGAVTTGGQIGLINPGLVVNSLGAIRCAHTTAGTLTLTTIPVGAFTVYASGCYQST